MLLLALRYYIFYFARQLKFLKIYEVAGGLHTVFNHRSHGITKKMSIDLKNSSLILRLAKNRCIICLMEQNTNFVIPRHPDGTIDIKAMDDVLGIVPADKLLDEWEALSDEEREPVAERATFLRYGPTGFNWPEAIVAAMQERHSTLSTKEVQKTPKPKGLIENFEELKVGSAIEIVERDRSGNLVGLKGKVVTVIPGGNEFIGESFIEFEEGGFFTSNRTATELGLAGPFSPDLYTRRIKKRELKN